ncbi:MAG TPA: DUF2934 domain-containing protein [Methylomirabilota bacterium]|nr:DUF2934 domain-containing protein [Methylomirabilota bacterium]
MMMAKKTDKKETTTRPPSTGRGRAKRTTAAADDPRGQGAPDLLYEQIAVRAYYIYLSRGSGHGRDLDDWLRAERELTERGERAS